MLAASFALRNRGYGGILLHSFQLDSREEVAKNAPDYSRGARHGLHQDKLNAFMGKAGSDIGAALSANMALLGDRLGSTKSWWMRVHTISPSDAHAVQSGIGSQTMNRYDSSVRQTNLRTAIHLLDRRR